MPKRKLPASLATLSQDSKKSKGYQKAIEGMAKAQENDKERNTIRKGDNHWEVCGHWHPSIYISSLHWEELPLNLKVKEELGG